MQILYYFFLPQYSFKCFCRFYFYSVINNTKHICANYSINFDLNLLIIQITICLWIKNYIINIHTVKEKLRHKIQELYSLLFLFLTYMDCFIIIVYGQTSSMVPMDMSDIYTWIKNWKFIVQNITGYCTFIVLFS